MRLALLSDIHANLEALSNCLAHAAGQNVTRYAFLGDLIGYGADPVAVLDVIADYAERGAIVILGNHDQAALIPSTRFTKLAAASADWTRTQLGSAQRRFIADLPIMAEVEDTLLVHASADQPTQWHYIASTEAAARSLDATRAGITLVGHIHTQALYCRGSDGTTHHCETSPGSAIPVPRSARWLASIGSVGQPRDGINTAGYAVLDTDRRTLTFHRVAYDWRVAGDKIRRAGLDPFLADRLEQGI